jgi:hypothetical protein
LGALEQVREKFLFELRNVLELDQTLLKGLENTKADVSSFVRVGRLVVFQLKVNSEEREL